VPYRPAVNEMITMLALIARYLANVRTRAFWMWLADAALCY